jgi:hypothetical protein
MRAEDETGYATRCLAGMRLAILAFLAACDAGRSPAPPAPHNIAVAPPVSHEVMATLERTACYGWCPVYTLTIHRDGRVEYHGEEFVKQRGSAAAELTPGQIDELDRAFATAQYFSLGSDYTHEDATDASSAITSYRKDGRDKKIAHYHGDEHAPDALTTLENAIDSIVGTERWIGTRAEREGHAGEWR